MLHHFLRFKGSEFIVGEGHAAPACTENHWSWWSVYVYDNQSSHRHWRSPLVREQTSKCASRKISLQSTAMCLYGMILVTEKMTFTKRLSRVAIVAIIIKCIVKKQFWMPLPVLHHTRCSKRIYADALCLKKCPCHIAIRITERQNITIQFFTISCRPSAHCRHIDYRNLWESQLNRLAEYFTAAAGGTEPCWEREKECTGGLIFQPYVEKALNSLWMKFRMCLKKKICI